MKTSEKPIGNVILSQLYQLDRNLMWCMASRQFFLIENGLAFMVSGLTFKGRVEITLNGKDLYDVVLKTPRSKAICSTHNDVFAEDLPSLLESLVENRHALEPIQEEFDLGHELRDDNYDY